MIQTPELLQEVARLQLENSLLREMAKKQKEYIAVVERCYDWQRETNVKILEGLNGLLAEKLAEVSCELESHRQDRVRLVARLVLNKSALRAFEELPEGANIQTVALMVARELIKVMSTTRDAYGRRQEPSYDRAPGDPLDVDRDDLGVQAILNEYRRIKNRRF